MERFYIKSTFTVKKEFSILAESKEEAEKMVRDLNVAKHEERGSTVTRVKINSIEGVSK
jgi:hypothetical protein